ncbi:ATP-binding protein [Magnetospirillum sp. SS-4]|uniref:ATP-binding protein n=1 Tax=Magnetospirillum sp. SS-4 TaxID=2681465 RepID=UPI001380C9E3|nr:ATP-binding protein [Magnetospirillum sp. SS-4]CAA7626946.1 conserved hypothetical protein [Magnetospirillum sp. SS-4]
MSPFRIVDRGVDPQDLDRIAEALGPLDRGRGDELRITVFDGRRDDDLSAALAPPAVCVIDAHCAGRAASGLDEAFLTLRVSTATANRLDVADAFAWALEHRHPDLAGQTADIRYALQEAIGNAVIHGNLGLDGTLRGSLDSLRIFAAMMEERMADPERSGRPITLAARECPDGIIVSVEDCGDGFAPDRVRPSDNPAAGGMGLSIIRMYCRSVVFDMDGRRIIMTFARNAQNGSSSLSQ